MQAILVACECISYKAAKYNTEAETWHGLHNVQITGISDVYSAVSLTAKEISTFCISDPFWGESTATCGFSSQGTSNSESFPLPWHQRTLYQAHDAFYYDDLHILSIKHCEYLNLNMTSIPCFNGCHNSRNVTIARRKLSFADIYRYRFMGIVTFHFVTEVACIDIYDINKPCSIR